MKLLRFFLVAIAVTVTLACLVGCSARKAMTPDGRVLYKSTRFGNRESIKRVEYRGPDGAVFIMEGFSGDQVEGMSMVAEASARGAVQGITGGAGGASALRSAPQVGNAAWTVPEGMKAVQRGSDVVLIPKDDPSVPQYEIQTH